jgi:hypothetical protein
MNASYEHRRCSQRPHRAPELALSSQMTSHLPVVGFGVVSEILSLRREVENKAKAIDGLEESLDESRTENVIADDVPPSSSWIWCLNERPSEVARERFAANVSFYRCGEK